ncbi:MAG: hypothetical protein JWP04_2612 [Belnapia sp.]|nr:hypothetical protein [Belnapia sp.]
MAWDYWTGPAGTALGPATLRPPMNATNIAGAVPPRAIIAIPAHDEADWLPACLAALAAQRPGRGAAFDPADLLVLVLANNCTDATAQRARAMAPDLPFSLLVKECRLRPAQANAGGARRAAMEAAAALAAPATILLSTDADARPQPGWLAANLRAIAAGADAVAGAIALDPAEAALLPAGLRRRERLEARYAARLDALAGRLDPVPHDPWPSHGTHSGASIGLRLAAYRAIGGMPAVPFGEDRALFAALARHDARIRHSSAARVIVSCRLEGRASGGMAETMRRRLADPADPLDARLEATIPALIRLRCRRALRRLWNSMLRPGEVRRLALAIGLAPGTLREIATAPSFGLAWEVLQAASPMLRRRPMTPASLPGEITRIEALLRMFSPPPVSPPPAAAAAGPADIALLAAGA